MPPCGLMLLFLGGVQVKADRQRLFSASSDSSSLLAPFPLATGLLGQLVPHGLPGYNLHNPHIQTQSSLSAPVFLPVDRGLLKLGPPPADSGALRSWSRRSLALARLRPSSSLLLLPLSRLSGVAGLLGPAPRTWWNRAERAEGEGLLESGAT